MAGAARTAQPTCSARDSTPAAQIPRDLRTPDARDPAADRPVGHAIDEEQYIAPHDTEAPTPSVGIITSAPPVRSTDPGFDWGDAGIGAGFLLALILLGLGPGSGPRPQAARASPRMLATGPPSTKSGPAPAPCSRGYAGVSIGGRETLASDDTRSSTPTLTMDLLSGRAGVSAKYVCGLLGQTT